MPTSPSDKQRRNAPWFTTWGDKQSIRKKLEALGATRHPRPEYTGVETYVIKFGPNK